MDAKSYREIKAMQKWSDMMRTSSDQEVDICWIRILASWMEDDPKQCVNKCTLRRLEYNKRSQIIWAFYEAASTWVAGRNLLRLQIFCFLQRLISLLRRFCLTPLFLCGDHLLNLLYNHINKEICIWMPPSGCGRLEVRGTHDMFSAIPQTSRMASRTRVGGL